MVATTGTPSAGEFQIGADANATAANFGDGAEASVKKTGRRQDGHRLGLRRRRQFLLRAGRQTAMRVDGPPYDTATGARRRHRRQHRPLVQGRGQLPTRATPSPPRSARARPSPMASRPTKAGSSTWCAPLRRWRSRISPMPIRPLPTATPPWCRATLNAAGRNAGQQFGLDRRDRGRTGSRQDHGRRHRRAAHRAQGAAGQHARRSIEDGARPRRWRWRSWRSRPGSRRATRRPRCSASSRWSTT